jgi:hypothetical protein
MKDLICFKISGPFLLGPFHKTEQKCNNLIFILQKCNISIMNSIRRNRIVQEDKLELKATIELENNLELYKIVDFLNKT